MDLSGDPMLSGLGAIFFYLFAFIAIGAAWYMLWGPGYRHGEEIRRNWMFIAAHSFVNGPSSAVMSQTQTNPYLAGSPEGAFLRAVVHRHAGSDASSEEARQWLEEAAEAGGIGLQGRGVVPDRLVGEIQAEHRAGLGSLQRQSFGLGRLQRGVAHLPAEGVEAGVGIQLLQHAQGLDAGGEGKRVAAQGTGLVNGSQRGEVISNAD